MKIGGERTAVSYSSSASMQTLPLGWVNRQREEPNISTEAAASCAGTSRMMREYPDL
jgi:hypothetical protein